MSLGRQGFICTSYRLCSQTHPLQMCPGTLEERTAPLTLWPCLREMMDWSLCTEWESQVLLLLPLEKNAPFMAKAFTEGGGWTDGGPWEPGVKNFSGLLRFFVLTQFWFYSGGSTFDLMTYFYSNTHCCEASYREACVCKSCPIDCHGMPQPATGPQSKRRSTSVMITRSTLGHVPTKLYKI